MMRNEYFSDGYFDGYEWAVGQVALMSDLQTLAIRVENQISTIPFSNGEMARQYRDGFAYGVKAVYRSRPLDERTETTVIASNYDQTENALSAA